MLDTILGCHGNKRREFKILNLLFKKILDDKDRIIDSFIEPFMGTCIISNLLFLENKDLTFICNDIEKHRVDHYNDMKDDHKRDVFYKLLNSIKTKEDYELYVNKNNKNEYNHYVISRMIHSYRYGLFPTTKKLKIYDKMHDNNINFLKHAIFLNKYYSVIFNEYKNNKNSIIYIDPPYLNSANKTYSTYCDCGEKKDNMSIYIDILDLLKYAHAYILVSINNNSITQYIYKDYIYKDYNKTYDSSFKKKNSEKNEKNIENILILTNYFHIKNSIDNDNGSGWDSV